MEEFPKPLPIPTPTSEPFWSGLRNEEIQIQQCQVCNDWIFYPRSHCPACLSTELQWRQVSGRATLYSYTVTHTPSAPHFADEVPQLLAMVDLAEGVRLTSTLVNVAPTEVRVGMSLRPYFDHLDEATTLLRFEPG